MRTCCLPLADALKRHERVNAFNLVILVILVGATVFKKDKVPRFQTVSGRNLTESDFLTLCEIELSLNLTM